jgi:hypothetical protein
VMLTTVAAPVLANCDKFNLYLFARQRWSY